MIFLLTFLIIGGLITFIGWYFGYKNAGITKEFIRKLLRLG